jgi:hypothetical protein
MFPLVGSHTPLWAKRASGPNSVQVWAGSRVLNETIRNANRDTRTDTEEFCLTLKLTPLRIEKVGLEGGNELLTNGRLRTNVRGVKRA